MNRRRFSVPPLPLRKYGDLNLYPVRLLSFHRTYSRNLYVSAPKGPFALLVAEQRSGEVIGAVHPFPPVHAGVVAMERTTPVRVEHRASFTHALCADVSIERHLSGFSYVSLGHSLGAYLAPCGTARLCFALRAPQEVSAFRKSFRRPPHRTRTKRFFEPSEKDTA